MEAKLFVLKTLCGFIIIFFFAVPPSIIDARTSADIVVKEGSPVNLSCDARGSPRPKIMWKREDGDLIRYNGGINIISFA